MKSENNKSDIGMKNVSQEDHRRLAKDIRMGNMFIWRNWKNLVEQVTDDARREDVGIDKSVNSLTSSQG